MTDKTMTLEGVRDDLERLGYAGYAEVITRHLSQPAEREDAQEKAEPVAGDNVNIPRKVALAIAGALDEAIDGLRAASVARQPTKLGRDRQADRLGTVRSAAAVLDMIIDGEPYQLSVSPPAERAVKACIACGGSRVDPGGLPICRLCGNDNTAPPPAAGVPDAPLLGVVWNERTEAAHLIKRGTEDEFCADYGCRRVFITPSPTIDVAAVREVIAELIDYDEADGEALNEWANELARAIGDAK